MESDRVSNDARSCQKSIDLSDDQKEDNRHPQRVCPIIELRKRNQNRRDIANDVSDVRNDPEERESEPDQKAKRRPTIESPIANSTALIRATTSWPRKKLMR